MPFQNWTRRVIGIATIVWGVFAGGLVIAQLAALALALAQGKPLALFMPLTEWGVLFSIPAGLGLLNKAGSVADTLTGNKYNEPAAVEAPAKPTAAPV